MAFSYKRPILAAVVIISLISIIYAIAALSLPEKFHAAYSSHELMAPAVFALNIPILLAWAALGIYSSVAVSLISIGAVLLLDMRSGMGGYSVFTISFVITSFFGYLNRRSRSDLSRSYGFRLEKLSEEINMLSSEIAQKKNGISALEGKMVRYFLLKEVVEALSATLSSETINNLIIDKALATLGKPVRALLFLVDAQKEELVLSVSRGELGKGHIKAKRGDVFDRWVLRHRKPLFIENIETDFRFNASDIEEAKASFGSLVSAPLISENKMMGVLRMDSPQSGSFAQDDLRLLGIIADLAAVSIQNANFYSRTQELAIRDALTGLFVRRYFMERFKEELARSARNKTPLSLLLLDIDHFKDYNDKYGHAAGDLVLKFLARQLVSMVREGDMVVRLGGEEIGILLYDTDAGSAIKEADRIRTVIRSKPIVFRRRQNGISVSIGISVYPKDSELEEELIRIADARLYKAKALGRDRVCSD